MKNQQFYKKYKLGIALAVLAVVIGGVFLRFDHIAQSDFFLYDEGYYLNHNRKFVGILNAYRPYDFVEFWKAFYAFLRFSLATGKALWFLLVDARVFFGGMTVWYIPKIVSAVSGVLTILIIYFFAKRYYDSKWVGLLSVVFLSVLPSHVFYSRLALQEAFSTLFFLLGFYFYLFPKRFGYRTFVSTFFFVCVFFTNYRLIITPVLVAFTELYMWLATKEQPSFRKYMWNTLIFFFLIFLIGNIDQAQNTIVTFGWMFHQANLAHKELHLINFLSYPYYLFRLESFFFALAFFGNLYFLIRKQWYKAFPFALVCVMMGIFSFAGDKGARYLCVGLPFMVMAVSALLVTLFEQSDERKWKVVVSLFTFFTFLTLTLSSMIIYQFKSDYRPAMKYLLSLDKNVKVMSSQCYVQNLYVKNKHDVAELPHGINRLLELRSKGYRYIIIGPQAYISYTKSGDKFDPRLGGYLGFIVSQVKPVKTFSHFSEPLLERFVYEHNENLITSIKFLRMKNKGFGKIKIYDVQDCLKKIFLFIQMQKVRELK